MTGEGKVKKSVFFVGTGFSKAIDPAYPTLKELAEQVMIEFDSESLMTHYNKEVPPSVKKDIGQLLTYLSMDLPWKKDYQKELDKALFKSITHNIQQYFLKPPRSVYKNKKLSDYICGNLAPVLTLNYDLVMEAILYSSFPESERKRYVSYRSFYKVPMAGLQSLFPLGARRHSSLYEEEKKPFPPVLKLHGSVNWLWDGETYSSAVYCRPIAQLADYEEKVIEHGLSPYIVPPVLDKNSFYTNRILKTLWQQAYHCIESAKEIFIIGFSFPDTDISVKLLFQSALTFNKNVKIYVVNSDTSADFIIKYKSIFGNRLLDFTYCCEDAVAKFIQEKI